MLYCKTHPIVGIDENGNEIESQLHKDLISLIGNSSEQRSLANTIWAYVNNNENFKEKTHDGMYDSNGEIKINSLFTLFEKYPEYETLHQGVFSIGNYSEIVKNIENKIQVRKGNDPINFNSYESAFSIAMNYNEQGILKKKFIAVVKTIKVDKEFKHQVSILLRSKNTIKLWNKQTRQSEILTTVAKILSKNNIPLSVIDEGYTLDGVTPVAYTTGVGDFVVKGMIGIQRFSDDNNYSSLEFLEDFGGFAFESMKNNPLYSRVIELARSKDIQQEVWGDEYIKVSENISLDDFSRLTAGKIFGKILSNQYQYSSNSLWGRFVNWFKSMWKKVSVEELSDMMMAINKQFKDILDDYIKDETLIISKKEIGQPVLDVDDQRFSKRNILIRKIINISNKQIFLLKQLKKADPSINLYTIRENAMALGNLTYLNSLKIQELINIINLANNDLIEAQKYLSNTLGHIDIKYLQNIKETHGNLMYFQELNKKLIGLRYTNILLEGFEDIKNEFSKLLKSSEKSNIKMGLLEDFTEDIFNEFKKEAALNNNKIYTSKEKMFLTENSIDRMETSLNNYIKQSSKISFIDLRTQLSINGYKNDGIITGDMIRNISNEVYKRMGWSEYTNALVGINSEGGLLKILSDNLISLKNENESQLAIYLKEFSTNFLEAKFVDTLGYFPNYYKTYIGNLLLGMYSKIQPGSFSAHVLTQMISKISKQRVHEADMEAKKLKREINVRLNMLSNPEHRNDLSWLMEIDEDGIPTGRFLSPSDEAAYEKAYKAKRLEIAKAFGIKPSEISKDSVANEILSKWKRKNREFIHEEFPDKKFKVRERLLDNFSLTDETLVFTPSSYEEAYNELQKWRKYFNTPISQRDSEMTKKFNEIKSSTEHLYTNENVENYILNPDAYLRTAYNISEYGWNNTYLKTIDFQREYAKYVEYIDNNSTHDEKMNEFIKSASRQAINVASVDIYPSKAYAKLTSDQKEFLSFLKMKKLELDMLLPNPGGKKKISFELPQVHATPIELSLRGQYRELGKQVLNDQFGDFQDDEVSGYRHTTNKDLIGDPFYDLPIAYVKKINPKLLTHDIAGAMVKYATMANKYFALEEVIHGAELGKKFMKINEPSLDDNNTNTKKGIKKNHLTTTSLEYVKTAYQGVLIRNFYGVSQYKAKLGKININKSSKLIQKASRIIALGLDMILPVINVVSGKLRTMDEAIGGYNIDMKSWMRAESIYWGYTLGYYFPNWGANIRNDKLSLIKELLGTSDEFGFDTLNTKFTRNRIVRGADIGGLPLWLQSWSGNAVNEVLYLSKIIFDKVLYNGKEISLYDVLEVKELGKGTKILQVKEGATQLDGKPIDSKYISNIKVKANNIVTEISGANDVMNKNNLNMTWYGNWMQMMKSWAISSIDRYFGATRQDVIKGTATAGMFVDVGRSLWNYFVESKLSKKSFWEITAAPITGVGPDGVTVDLERKKFTIHNYKRAAVATIQLAILFGIKELLLSLRGSDDDDEKVDPNDLDWNAILLLYTYRVFRESAAVHPLAPVAMMEEWKNVVSPNSAAGVSTSIITRATWDIMTQDRETSGNLILNEDGTKKLVAKWDPELEEFDMETSKYIGLNKKAPKGYRIVREKKYKNSLMRLIPGKRTYDILWENEANEVLHRYIQGKYKLKK